MNTIKSLIRNRLIQLCKRLGETSPILIDFSSIDDGKTASNLLDTMRAARFLEPKTSTAPLNKKVLIISPHPDDEVIGMGGTLVQMIEQGCDVSVISLTFGGDKKSVNEAQKAAKFLGYRFIHFFDFLPKNISLDKQTLEKFTQLYHETNPDILCLPFMLDDHDDHRRASDLLLRACESSPSIKSNKAEVWAYQVYTALPLNGVVNISDVIERKIDAISQYESRFSQRNWAHFAKGLNAFNVRFLAGNKNADYAEVFFKADIKNYLKMSSLYFNSKGASCYNSKNYI